MGLRVYLIHETKLRATVKNCMSNYMSNSIPSLPSLISDKQLAHKVPCNLSFSFLESHLLCSKIAALKRWIWILHCSSKNVNLLENESLFVSWHFNARLKQVCHKPALWNKMWSNWNHKVNTKELYGGCKFHLLSFRERGMPACSLPANVILNVRETAAKSKSRAFCGCFGGSSVESISTETLYP